MARNPGSKPVCLCADTPLYGALFSFLFSTFLFEGERLVVDGIIQGAVVYKNLATMILETSLKLCVCVGTCMQMDQTSYGIKRY